MPTNRLLPGCEALTANGLTRRILLEIPRAFPGSRLWRANCGAAVPLSVVKQAISLLTQGKLEETILYLQRQRPVTFGIPGQADTSGILAPSGHRLEIEIKAGSDRLRPEQVTFREMVTRTGGIYVEARSVEDAVESVRRAMEGK